MKTAMLYFSQSGNTEKTAESIQAGIVEATGHCRLMELDAVDPGRLAHYDLVGIGCPVFYYKEPFHVRWFIQRLPNLREQPWFVFCTHGSVMGITLVSMTRQLEQKGAKVIGSFHLYADAFLPFYPYPTVTTGHPDDHDLAEARRFGVDIVRCHQAVSRGDDNLIKRPDPVAEDWARKEAELLTIDFMDQVMPRLFINPEICAQCGECQDGCPVAGIDITADPPRIQNPCIYCWYCAKVCPHGAIEADWTALEKAAPGNYARYIRALNDAEKRGEFRWLMDPDTLDFNTPLHRQDRSGLEKGPKKST
jgi:ferredoxin/flavodoxin